jgi:hypothetical protein
MALTAYSDLKTEIASWMGRQDLTSQIDTFIDLFEAWANRTLRTRQMEAEALATATEYIAFPTDFLELRDIQYQANPRRQLAYVTPEYADVYDTSGTAGDPNFYTLVGNEIRLIPAPSSSATNVRISYWQKITPLDSTNTTNWLLTAYPDAYLYGSLIHARAFITDPAMASFVADGWGRAMADIQSAGKQSNLGGSLRIRTA